MGVRTVTLFPQCKLTLGPHNRGSCMGLPQKQRAPAAQRVSPKARRTQEQRRTETRRKLVNGAIQLKHEVGFARLTLGEVASRARLTTSALQHHFISSHDLLRAVVE